MVAEVVARSDGNPLYVEELSAAVLDTKATAPTRVPDSLQSSLMARLDGLGDAKKVAQTCSVLGRRFARPLLTYVSDLTATQLDINLALLVGHDVIRPIGGADDGRYEFKHALLRDAAYESMLFSVRRRLHEVSARSLEKHFPDVVRTEPELLAQHFSLAGLTIEAGAYAELAGDRATAACAFQETIASYQEALRQNDGQPEGSDRDRRTLDLLLKLGPAVALFRGAQDPELRDIYRRAEALSRRLDDNHSLFKAVWGLWYNANISRELDDAGEFAQRLVTIAEHVGDEDLGLEASHCRWSSALFSADYRQCLADAQHGTQLYDRHRHHKLGLVFGGHDPGVCAFGCLGQAQVYAGDVEDGFASVEIAIALAEELNHPGTLAHGLLMGLIIGTVAHTPERLQSYVERTLELSRRFKLPPQEAIGTYHLAWIEAETGNREKGVNQMTALYDRVTAIGPIILLYKVMYVEQLLKAGRTHEALAAADTAIASLRCPDRGLMLSELLRLRGECLFALGQGKEGGRELARAEAMGRRDGAGLLRLRAANSLYKVVGEPSRPILEAAFAVMPPDWSGQEVLNARSLLLR
jgi:tetratricopeptide (TPR) repeat protein